MKPLHEYFSVDAIITEYCRERLKLAGYRHDADFFHRISTDQPSSKKAHCALSDDLQGLFPSRKIWKKLRPVRNKRNGKNAHELNLKTLRRTVWTFIHKAPDEPWVMKLLDRAESLRARALNDSDFSFSPPLIVGACKKPSAHQYRPISIYGTNDKIIEKITARYLRDRLDFCFSRSSLAYRGRQEGDNKAVTHHDALFGILNFRKAHSTLFVAEADFRNFMDSISHDVASESLHELIRQGKIHRPGLEIDPRAIRIYDAYLASYSFKRQVLGQGLATLRKKDNLATFPWPADILREMHGEDDDLTRIGIPQGGAISCLITNIILNDVDQAVEEIRGIRKAEMLYQRYCDDMSILSPDKTTCQLAMAAYQKVAWRKKLPMHEPQEVCFQDGVTESKPDYWNMKSKLTYLWSDDARSGIPWIQFVGYQIRYDGQVRIRSKTLEKNRQKMTDLTNKLLGVINPQQKCKGGVPVYAPGLRMSRDKILHAFEMKLISMAVGRRKFGQPAPTCGDDIMPMCWAHGYKPLWDVPFNPARLKELDRHRDRQLRRLHCRLKHLPAPDRPAQDAGGSKKPARYYGAPFSYHCQFVRSTERPGECKDKRLWLRVIEFIQRLRAALQSRF